MQKDLCFEILKGCSCLRDDWFTRADQQHSGSKLDHEEREKRIRGNALQFHRIVIEQYKALARSNILRWKKHIIYYCCDIWLFHVVSNCGRGMQKIENQYRLGFFSWKLCLLQFLLNSGKYLGRLLLLPLYLSAQSGEHFSQQRLPKGYARRCNLRVLFSCAVPILCSRAMWTLRPQEKLPCEQPNTKTMGWGGWKTHPPRLWRTHKGTLRHRWEP